MPPVDADVVLVAEGRDCQIDARRTIVGRLRLRPLHRPTRIAVLLRQLGGLVLPSLRNAAFLDVALLAVAVALLRRRDDRGVDDLPAHGKESSLGQRRLVGPEQHLDRRLAVDPRASQRFAERPNRIGVRHRIGQAQPEEAHERQPVLDQILGPFIRQAMRRLQDQDLEHEHMVERRAPALRSTRPWNRSRQIRPEYLEIHDGVQPFEVVALGRKLPQTLIDIEKPDLAPSAALSRSIIGSGNGRIVLSPVAYSYILYHLAKDLPPMRLMLMLGDPGTMEMR